MLCTNGEVVSPKGETGIFFICTLTGNVCRYSRWCNQEEEFVMISDKNGKSCKDLTIAPKVKKPETVISKTYTPRNTSSRKKKK
jgi:hypothetical protein